jgi:peptidoglycan/LPS O-acetylase OafA/YrhL
MASTSSTLTGGGRIPVGRILRAGLTAAAAAAVINVLYALLMRGVLGASGDFAPLQPLTVALSTIGGALAATAVFVLLSRFARRPVRPFQLIALVALLLSFVNPFIIIGSDSPRFGGATTQTALALMPMHVVVAALSVWLLSSTARRG